MEESSNPIQSSLVLRSEPDILQTRRDLQEIENDIGLHMERVFAEKEMPPIAIKKSQLGYVKPELSVNPNEKIEIRPVKNTSEQHWGLLNWQVDKIESTRKLLPKVSAEPVDASTLKQMSDLPRNYHKSSTTEKTLLFKNSEGRVVGWTAISEPSEGDCHLGFIGVSDKTGGYGSAILNYLKERYDSIGLSVLPYVTDDLRSRMSAQEVDTRLRRFYTRNGFQEVSNGYSWNRRTPNLEDAQSGDSLEVTYLMIANGQSYSQGQLMDAYLRELIATGKSSGVLNEKDVRSAQTWLKLREEYKRLTKVLDEMDKAKYQVEEQHTPNL